MPKRSGVYPESAVVQAQHRSHPEDEEQQALFQWAQWMSGRYPELELLFHIPNGGKRNKAEAARMKAGGVRAGVPDLCLPVARGGFHGLYIELKAGKGTASQKQKEWIGKLTAQGYRALVLTGWEAASRAIEDYLRMEE